MAAHSMATLLSKLELVGVALHNASSSLSSPPAFPSFACTSRLGVTSISGSTISSSSNACRTGLWSVEANRGRNGGFSRAGSSSGGGGGGFKGFDDGDIYSDLLGKMNPLEEMQSLVEQELRNYTSEMQRRAVPGESMDSLTQEPKRSRPRTQEQRSKRSLYTRNPSSDGSERRKSTTSIDNIGNSTRTREDHEGDGFSGQKFSPAKESSAKRDVWVNPKCKDTGKQ